MAASNWLVNDSLEILYPLTIAEMDHYPTPHHECCEKACSMYMIEKFVSFLREPNQLIRCLLLT